MPISKTEAGKPPAARAPRASSARTAPVASIKAQVRTEAVSGVFDLGAMLCMLKGWNADAGALSMHGPAVAHQIALLAEDNESIARLVDSLSNVGPYTGLVMAVMPLTLQIMANHGQIDASAAGPASGVMDPAILEQRVKAESEKRAMQILTEIEEMQKEARETAAAHERFKAMDKADAA